MQKAGGTRNLGLYGKELGISNNGKMSESITFGSVHQKRRARAQPLRHARASCRESRFQAEKEIGDPKRRPARRRRRSFGSDSVARLFTVNGGNTASHFRFL